MRSASLILIAAAATTGYPGACARADWVAVPECSSLVFFASQQGARFEGRFNRLGARVEVDAAAAEPSHIQAIIDLSSVDTGDEERDAAVVDADFFNTALYPTSVFKSLSIHRRGDGFRASAELTIRNQSRPVVFDFTWSPPDGDQPRARLEGRADLKRLAFGVGQGDWADTEWIGDEVEVRVDLCLEHRADSNPAP